MLRKKHLILLRELDNLIADLGGTEKNTGRTAGNQNIRVMPTFGGTFYTRTTETRFTPENMQAFAIETLEEFLHANIHGNTQQTMKIFVDDADYDRCIGQFDGRKHRLRAVIPTMKIESGADIIEIPPCTMLTMAVRCDYEKSGKFFRALWDRAVELGFTPEGPVCIAGLPDSFTERDFTRTDSTLRLMLRTTTPAQRLEL